MTDPLVPPLRSGVRLERDPARGTARLHDLALGQRAGLDPSLAAIAAVLDSPQSVAAVASRSGQDSETVERAVAVLAARHLLATPAADELAAAAQATADVIDQDPATVPLLIRPEAAFDCTMCGSCCGGHNIGPVLDDTLAGLEPHAEALARRTGATTGLFITMPGPPTEPPRVLCRTRQGWCVFLAPDGGCVIHADLGGDMKPRSCQLFPYEFTATPDGVAVSISSECRDLRRASAGPRLVDQQPAIRALLAKVPAGHLDRVRPVLRADGETQLSWSSYQARESALHSALDAHARSPFLALLAMRASLAEVAGAPADGPERADVADYGVRLDALIVAVAGSLRSLRADLAQDTPTFVNRADGLDPMIDALVGLRAELPRVIDTPRDPAVAEVFSLTTHQRLMGKELAHAATLRDGLARLVWSWLLARSLMIRRARRARRFHVTGDDAMDAVATLTFLHRTEPVKRLLDAHAEALASLCVDELPTLVAHAAELALRDDRVELVSF